MTEILDRIDTAISGWEACDQAWAPGDPLHPHPYQRGSNTHCVRPMIELLDDARGWRMRCEPCAVSWAGDAPCWMCSEGRPFPGRDGWSLGPWQIDYLDYLTPVLVEHATAEAVAAARELAELINASAPSFQSGEAVGPWVRPAIEEEDE